MNYSHTRPPLLPVLSNAYQFRMCEMRIVEDSLEDVYSSTMSRFKDDHVKFGAARYNNITLCGKPKTSGQLYKN
jgi:hypothetical protein